jgi:hypothetical protein
MLLVPRKVRKIDGNVKPVVGSLSGRYAHGCTLIDAYLTGGVRRSQFRRMYVRHIQRV